MSARETASAAWGVGMPEWVNALAEACDRTSQNRVAHQLGRSAARVSTVLRNSYAGNMARVEELVRGARMHETTTCPSLGEIERQVCSMWRDRAKKPNVVNS